MNNLSYGEKIAIEDSIIKDTILNIENKEKNIFNKYIHIKNFINNFKGNIDNVFISELDSIKIYILYKLQSKKKQYSLLMKLIDYINYLDDKNKDADFIIFLNKVRNLEKEIDYLNRIL